MIGPRIEIEERHAVAVDRTPVLRAAVRVTRRRGDLRGRFQRISVGHGTRCRRRRNLTSGDRQRFGGLTPDPAVLAFDRRQRGTFRKSFEDYAATRVIPARIKRAKALMQRHAALLARVERQFGVPSTLLMAIWTLESDNGTGDMGSCRDPHHRHPGA
jgi:membrane-bound lytic murein transglycosylase B